MNSRDFERQVRRLSKKNSRVQVHVSSHDLIEMQKADEVRRAARREAMARFVTNNMAQEAAFRGRFPAAREQERQRHAAKTASLRPFAKQLHRHWLAGPLLVVYTLSLLVAPALPFTTVLLLAIGLLIACADWHNFATLHGWIPWRAWLRTGQRGLGRAFWSGIIYLLLIYIVPIVYLVQAWRLAPKMREIERARLQAEIARLEASLGRPVVPFAQLAAADSVATGAGGAAPTVSDTPAAPVTPSTIATPAPASMPPQPALATPASPIVPAAPPQTATTGIRSEPTAPPPSAPLPGKPMTSTPIASPGSAVASIPARTPAPTPPASHPSAQTIVIKYLAAWNQPDEGQRRELLRACWAEDGVYSDQYVTETGREALNAHIAGFIQRFPSDRFILTAGPDTDSAVVRFSWALVSSAGATVFTGDDFGELAPDGRLTRVHGFYNSSASPARR